MFAFLKELVFPIAVSFLKDIVSKIFSPFNDKKIIKIRMEKLIDVVSPLDLELVEYYIGELRQYEKEISLAEYKSMTVEDINRAIDKETKLYQDYILNNVSFKNRDAEALFYCLIHEDLTSRNIISYGLISIYFSIIMILLISILYKLLIHLLCSGFHVLRTWVALFIKKNNFVSNKISELCVSFRHFIDSQATEGVKLMEVENDVGTDIIKGLSYFIGIFIVIPVVLYFIADIIYNIIRLDIVLGLVLILIFFGPLIQSNKRVYNINKDMRKKEFINAQQSLLTKEHFLKNSNNKLD
ncbi:conserved membrane protein of unknown function [Tepidanaerobacter acetatoxydans Re1]|uniref:Uncharacterized protein n=1 Tax=Tepidanaerobacter acetatoxydans (strain DSM 21804 / JCM 16047 / Re1) TaxID=1209989 RepID=F4LSE4_TEPAE|nr:hypothetical protein [Tepidanaerobacter acetatoxydans]AEE91210.1 hypothetical protein TepRe1_1064 [Tepidanaerobacter acetatoxydans Re1]CCP25884.1 conserved membrane protein of unknown function [Tepidanaerobacter acetatoxydans Re1]